MQAPMQRVLSSSSLKDNGPGGGGGGVGGSLLGSKQGLGEVKDRVKGVVDPDKSPVVEVPVGGHVSSVLPPPPPNNMRTKTASFTSLLMPQEDSVRRYKRRKTDWACELQRIAMFVGVFSLMAWVTYLFLTKDE